MDRHIFNLAPKTNTSADSRMNSNAINTNGQEDVQFTIPDELFKPTTEKFNLLEKIKNENFTLLKEKCLDLLKRQLTQIRNHISNQQEKITKLIDTVKSNPKSTNINTFKSYITKYNNNLKSLKKYESFLNRYYTDILLTFESLDLDILKYKSLLLQYFNETSYYKKYKLTSSLLKMKTKISKNITILTNDTLKLAHSFKMSSETNIFSLHVDNFQIHINLNDQIDVEDKNKIDDVLDFLAKPNVESFEQNTTTQIDIELEQIIKETQTAFDEVCDYMGCDTLFDRNASSSETR